MICITLLRRIILYFIDAYYEVRLIGGVIGLIVILFLHPKRRAVMHSLRGRTFWEFTLPGSFIGSYLAMIAWLSGMKFTDASVASVLNQTSNIWIFLFAGIFLKETLNTRKPVGIILGVGGTILVMFNRL